MKRLLKIVVSTLAVAFVGIVSASAQQTDVTSEYLSNADFEGTFTVHSYPTESGTNKRAIYAPDQWTISYTNGESNDMTALNSTCLQWNNFSGKPQPAQGGNNVYWIRFRWGNSEQLILSQTATLPAGTYRISCDAYLTSNTGAATLSAGGQSVSVGNSSSWNNVNVSFTLANEQSVTISLTAKQNSAVETIVGFDNVKIEKFDTTEEAAIPDGTYFFKDDTDKFWLRGEPYGSAVQLYDWGMPVNVTTDATGVTTLKFADASDWYIFDDGTGIYADNPSHNNRFWKVTKQGEKYIFQNTVSNRYMKVNGTRIMSDASSSTAFTLVTPAEHQTVITNLANAQASAAASSADLTATTPDALQNAVSSWTAVPVIAGSTPSSTAEKYQGGQWDSRTVYSNTVNITQPGLYKFTIQAFYRLTGNSTTYNLHMANADNPPVYVFFGDTKTIISSVMRDASSTAYSTQDYSNSGNHYPNGQASALEAFKAGRYVNTIWAYISEAGDYNYGIQYLGWAGSHEEWTCYTKESVSLTLYTNEGFVNVSDGVLTAAGNVTLADVTAELDNTISIVDLTAASGLSNVEIPTTQNPNLLTYAKAGQVSNTKNVIVGNTCSNLILSKQNTAFFVPKAFTATSAKYTVADTDLANGEYATLMIPYTSRIPTGKAYTLDQGINVIGGEVKATEETTVPANKPVLITGSGQFTATNVEVPAFTRGTTFDNGELTGVYSTTQAPVGSYVLQNHASSPNGVAFYLVNDVQPNVGPFRAYIKPQASNAKALRVIFINGDDTTGIGTLHNDGTLTMDNAEYYTVGGARLSAPQKGLNVVRYSNGIVKKIFVK